MNREKEPTWLRTMVITGSTRWRSRSPTPPVNSEEVPDEGKIPSWTENRKISPMATRTLGTPLATMLATVIPRSRRDPG